MAEKTVKSNPEITWVEDDINVDPTSVPRSICVTGFPATTDPRDLIIHFQRKKNGGDDVEGIILSERGIAIVTFNKPGAATLVLQKEQTFGGVTLTVQRYDENVFKNYRELERVLSNGVRLSIYQADITDQKVDAIVNPTDAKLQLKYGDDYRGVVAADILRKGGSLIEEEAKGIMSDRDGRPLNAGEVVYTRGGDLPCRFVIHTVDPRFQCSIEAQEDNLFHRACLESFRFAAQQNMCSIAFPSITQNFDIVSRERTQEMLQAVDDFSSSSSHADVRTLRDIRIIVRDKETLDVFSEEFLKRYGSQNAQMGNSAQRGSFFISKLKSKLGKKKPVPVSSINSALPNGQEGLMRRPSEETELKECPRLPSPSQYDTKKQEFREKDISLKEFQKIPDDERQSRNMIEEGRVIEELQKLLKAERLTSQFHEVELSLVPQMLYSEIQENETVIEELRKELDEEQQTKRRLEKGLQAELVTRQSCQKELEAKDNTVKEQQLHLEEERQQKTTLEERLRALQFQMERERNRQESVIEELQKELDKEKQVRRRVEVELLQARLYCTELEESLQIERLTCQSYQTELQTKENNVRGQLRLLEEERQQKTTLEETLRTLRLEMEGESNRHASTERELRSALSASREELTEYQRRQKRDWVIQREEINLNGNKLGQGAWAIVRGGIFRGCQVAIKQIHEVILSSHNRRLFEREMDIASHCRHPNLLQFIGATNDDGSPLLVTELLDTTLRELVSQRELNRDEIVIFAFDVAKGLNYLHLNKPLPIVHRDISSANVLLWRRGECWRAKLGDYGSANFVRHVMTVGPGAMSYAAPEACTLHAQQSTKVDVYSFGVLLCEMCIGELPDSEDRRNQIRRVTDKTLRELVSRCVRRDPQIRPAMSDIICELEQPTKST